jgi:hypothetical protein
MQVREKSCFCWIHYLPLIYLPSYQSVLPHAKGSSISIIIQAELSVMDIRETINVAVHVARKTGNGIVATSTQPM